MKHNYILDTSALITNPNLYNAFKDSEIIIPIAVIEELDKLKKGLNETAKNARIAIRWLDEKSQTEDIIKGISIDTNIIKIEAEYRDLSLKKFKGFGDPLYGDTHILACAFDHYEQNKNTTLISNDFNLRLKVRSRGMKAIEAPTTANIDEIYTGIKNVKDKNGLIGLSLLDKEEIEDKWDLLQNQFICFNDLTEKNVSIGRKIGDKIKLVKKHFPWDLKSRSTEQACALDLLLDKNVDLVSMIGMAGSGKTLLAVASALELVINKKEYDKLTIYRPITSVGDQMGYLPGTLEEKIEPHMGAIFDALELLFSNETNKKNKNKFNWEDTLDMFMKQGKIELEAISFIRGRSIPNSLILIDEAQNLSIQELTALLTRASNGTKIILTGDISQLDNLRLDAISNGLTQVVQKFKGSAISGHITLQKGERSNLANEAVKLLL